MVFLGWCIRRGTRGESDGDADYLPPIIINKYLQYARIIFFLLADFHPLQAPINTTSHGHVGNMIYPCVYDPGFKTQLGTRCRNPSFDRCIFYCVIGRRVVACVNVVVR